MCAPVLGRWVKAFFAVVVGAIGGAHWQSLYRVYLFRFLFLFCCCWRCLNPADTEWMENEECTNLCGVYAAARETHFSTRERERQRERINKCGTVVPRYIDIVWNNMNVFSVFIRIHVLKSLRAIIITTPRSVDDSLRSFCWRLFVASSVCRLRSSLVSLLSHRLCCATVWIVWVLRKYAYDV